jgi:hypothetical protein
MPHVPEVTVHSYYTFIALGLANDRVREAEQRRLLYGDAQILEANERSLRRSAAGALAAFSRATGRIARRLDDQSVPQSN